MNTFKRKIFAAAIAGLLLAGCASDKEYLKAQADSITAQANARVAEAQASSDQAKAIIAVAAKLDAGGAAAYMVGVTMKGAGGGSASIAPTVQRPRDWLDYLNAGTSLVSAIGNIAVPWVTVTQNAKVQQAGFQRDVQVNASNQAGETARTQALTGIAPSLQPNVTTTNTLSGAGVIGSGTYTGPVTRNCQGGAAAAGGTGGSGGAAVATTPGGQGGAGAAGGSAPGGTC